MKIMVLHIRDNGKPAVQSMADSTTLRSGQPFFVPGHVSHYAVEPMLALRIGRLGMCIAPRFAPRYIDAATATFIVRPVDDNMRPTPLDGMASLLDGSVFVGQWVPVRQGQEMPSVEWSHNDSRHTLAGSEVVPSPVDAITHLSKYCTLKMGDIVCLAPLDNPLQPIAIGDRVAATVGDTQVLRNNIK